MLIKQSLQRFKNWGRLIFLEIGLTILCSAAVTPQLDVLLPAGVDSVAVTPDNKAVALGLGNGVVLVVSSEDGHILQSWPAEGANQVERLELDAKGERLVACSPDRVIRVYDLKSGKLLLKHIQKGYFPGASISPDGRYLCVTAKDDPVEWIEIDSGQTLATWRDPDKTHTYFFAQIIDNKGHTILSDFDHPAVLIDAIQGQKIAVLDSNSSGPIRSLFKTQNAVGMLGTYTIAWWTDEKIAAAIVAQAEKIEGYTSYRPDAIGLAVMRAAPPDQWQFWADRVRNAKSTARLWAEPIWPELLTERIHSSAYYDPVRGRLWLQSPDLHWKSWDTAKLGIPPGFRLGGYAAEACRVDASTVLVQNIDQTAYLINWKEGRVLAQSGPFRLRSEQQVRVAGFDVDAKGQMGDWIATPLASDQTIGWQLSWRAIDGGSSPTQLFTSLMSNHLPHVTAGPGNLVAIIAESPGLKWTGTSPPTREKIAQALRSRQTTDLARTPSVEIWDRVTGKKMTEAFEELTKVGVVKLRWSMNGKMLVVRQANDGSDTQQIRVFSVKDGRQVGPMTEIKYCSDFQVSDNGDLIISDRNGKIIFRDKTQPEFRELMSAAPESASAHLALSADGKLAALLFSNGIVHLVNTDVGSVLQEWLPWEKYSLDSNGPAGNVVFLDNETLGVLFSGSAFFRVIAFDLKRR